jgi:hypothetical protein
LGVSCVANLVLASYDGGAGVPVLKAARVPSAQRQGGEQGQAAGK